MKIIQGKIFLLPVVAAALVACGGGGSTPTAPETITLTGTVAKGIVSGAKMRVLSASATPVVLASGFTTDDDGRYTINMNKPSGPVVIEADLEGADIADETRPGETYEGKAGEKMRAIISPTASATAATANVTPFSEMAVDLVKESGWRVDAVSDANNIVRQMLGNTDYLTADPATGDMLVKLTAVQQMVENNKDSGGLGAVLTELRDAADGSSSTVSIKPALTDTLKEACGESIACDTAFVKPPEVPIGTGNLIDPVYSLFQDLRDTLLAYSNDTKNGELDVAAVKLDEAVKAAIQPIDDEMLGVLAMFQSGDRLFREFNEDGGQLRVSKGSVQGRIITRNIDGVSLGGSSLPRYECHVAKAGLITTASGEVDLDPNVAYDMNPAVGTANLFACDGVGTIGRLYPARDGINSYWHRATFIPQANGSVKYVHQLRTRPFDLTGTTGISTRVRTAYGNLTVNRDADELTGFALNGKLVPGLKGHAEGEYATLDRVDAALSFVSSEPSGSSLRFDMSGSMKLYKKEQLLVASSVEIASGSFAEAKTDIPFTYQDYVFGGSSCPAGYASMGGSAPFLWCVGNVTGTTAELGQLKLDVSIAAPGVKFQGIVSADTPSFDSTNTAYSPTKMSLQGKIFEADGAGHRLLLDGKGSVELLNYASFDATSGSDAPMKMAFDGKVLIKNRPEMGLTLAGSQTASGAQSLSGTFFWNSKTLRFEGPVGGAVTVSNDAGVRFTIPKNGSNLAQDVFQGNVKVGTVNIDNKRIEYTDGRFQQF